MKLVEHPYNSWILDCFKYIFPMYIYLKLVGFMHFYDTVPEKVQKTGKHGWTRWASY